MIEALKLALEVNESMKDVLKQVNELIAENKSLKEALAVDKESLTTEAQPPQRTEQNFCSRCGKRTADLTHIHTCTPPQD